MKRKQFLLLPIFLISLTCIAACGNNSIANSNTYINTLQTTDSFNNTQSTVSQTSTTNEQANTNGTKLGIYASSASKKAGIYLTLNDDCHWGLYDDICSFLYLAPRVCIESKSDISLAIGDLSEDAIEIIDPTLPLKLLSHLDTALSSSRETPYFHE